jgi:quercetin 2,3-dioxygenase
VSWLFSGQLEHRDSVSSIQVVNPGELNLMTAGGGIAHSELSEQSAAPLHGVQLWVVLPESACHQAPHFEHHENLPDFEHDHARVRVLVGRLLGHESPAATYSPLMGAQITLGDAPISLPREQGFEYGLLPVDSNVNVNGTQVPTTHLLSIDDDSETITISGPAGSRVMLLGGEPFTEPMVMWWNFIGRSHEEVEQMRSDWEQGSQRFAAFDDRIGGRIPAPEMPTTRLRAR